jgi:hypothetical protein
MLWLFVLLHKLGALRSSHDPCPLYRSLCTLSPLSRVGTVLIALVPSATSYQSMCLCSLLLASILFIIPLYSSHRSSPSWKCLAVSFSYSFLLLLSFPSVATDVHFSEPSRLAVRPIHSPTLRKNGLAVALPTHLPLRLMLRTNGAIPPLQHTPPWFAKERLPLLLHYIYILFLLYQYV